MVSCYSVSDYSCPKVNKSSVVILMIDIVILYFQLINFKMVMLGVMELEMAMINPVIRMP